MDKNVSLVIKVTPTRRRVHCVFHFLEIYERAFYAAILQTTHVQKITP
jgi:hypothetical protein